MVRLKKKLRRGLLITGYLICSFTLSAQTNTWDGSSSNSWGTAANWSLNQIPTASHDVVIPNGFATVDINVAAVCNTLTISTGDVSTTVGITGSNSLTVTDAVVIGTGSSPGGFGGFFATRNKILAVNAGTLSCASITMTAPTSFNKDSRLTASTGTINVSGDITMPAGSNDVTFSGAGTLNLAGSMSGGDFVASTSTVNYNGNNQTISNEYSYNNLTFSGSGDASIDGDLTIGGDFTVNTVGTLDFGSFSYSIGGDWTNDNGTLDLTNSTIDLDGAGQIIGGANSTTFNDLTLSGSGTKTFSLSTTINGTLNIIGVVADLSTFTDHTANALSLDNVGQTAGTWGSTSSAAANTNDTFFAASTGIITTTVDGPTTFYSRQTGNWNAAASWSTVTYGNATNASGTFPQAGDIVNIGGDLTITVTANAACASMEYQTGTGNTNIVQLNAGISLDVSDRVFIPTDGEDNTLDVGAGVLTAQSLEFSPNFFDVSELTISTGTATITGDVTNTGAVFLGIPAQANIAFTGAGLLQVGGDFLNSQTATFTAGTGTVDYNGGSAQVIGDFTYNNLILSGSGAKTMAGAMDVDGDITISSGTSFNSGSYTHTIAGDWFNNGGTIDNSNSTISFDGVTQSIGGSSATNFKNLTIDGSTTTLSFATDVSATLSIQNGGVANLGTILTHTSKTLAFDGGGQTPGTWGSSSSAAVNQNDTYFAATSGIVTVTNTIYYARQTGNWNLATSWSTVDYGNITNSGLFPTIGDIARIGGGFTITVTTNAECSFLEYETGAGNTNTVTINNGVTLDVTDGINITSLDGDDNTMNVGAGTLNTPSLVFSPEVAGTAISELAISTGTATITGDVSHTGNDFLGFKEPALITFSGAGLLQVGGDFLTTDDCDLTASTGTIEYNGSAPQTVADFTYYNLTFDNSSSAVPSLTLSDDVTVTNTLTMTEGILDMDGFTLTLGNGAASTLSRTTSTTTNWMYGGTLERYWPASTAVTSSSGNFYGLFPVGTSSSSSYRPVEFNSTTPQTGAGLVSVTHTDFSGTTALSPVYDDGGTDIEVKDNSAFDITNAATGGTYDVSVTMTGLSSGTLDDYRLAKNNGSTTVTTVGSHVAASGSGTNPTANRSGVTSAQLAGDWRITSTDISATPLPVELISFEVELNNHSANLQWTTAQETNNDRFEIKYSNDGLTFETIGEVKGNGTVNELSEYSFTHSNLSSGFNYYRLKQVDYDGQFEYSEIKRVNLGGFKDVTINIYPNPSDDHANVIINEGLATSIELITLSGTVLKSIKYEEGIDKHTFDVTGLRTGMYLIRVQGPEVNTIKRLIIK